MSEKQQKTRLYKVAKEINLSHDTLIDFLVKKGFDVKNHMSIVDDVMLEAIEKHFKKERADAERHARKKKEYDEQDRKRRGDETPAVPTAEVEIEKPPEIPVEVPAEEPLPEEPQEEIVPVHQVEIEAPAQPVEEIPQPIVEQTETPSVAEVEAAPPKATEIAKAVEEVTPDEAPKKKPAKDKAKKKHEDLDVSIQSSMPKMGLTVKGKIELEPKKVEQPAPAAASEGDTSIVDKPKHKKKKKKRVEGEGEPVEGEDSDSGKKTVAKKGRTREVDALEVQSAIKRTIASMGDGGVGTQRAALRRKKRARREEEQLRESERSKIQKRTLNIYEYATVAEISSLMGVNVGEVITSLIGMGVMASINQRLDIDTITLVASEFGFDVQQHEEALDDVLEDLEDAEETLEQRPPIVTIMGHVDHGKTSLLDHIRESNVVAGESGGITQHIGAYTVSLDSGRKITFLDTPGHEAFTAMRARGAQVTDIVVLVVAADDSVMPQTVEAISHALAAKVPMVIAINKIDKPESNPERIRQQLAERNVLVEAWGGRYGAVEISAKTGLNVDNLLERILLEADILDLKANPEREARGWVIESQLDKGKGIIATVLVQKGTLQVGDAFVAGNEYGRVRALLDERGHRVEEAPPSTPVQVLGFNGMPQAGDVFVALPSDRDAREIASERTQIKRESEFRRMRRKTLDDISEQIKIGGVSELSLIVKGDVDGSIEALSDAFMKLSNEEVHINVIHSGVGGISESDVLLASASDAIIIGFHVRPNLNARRLAEAENVDIRLYDIIYDAINDVKSALEGLLRPMISEKVSATVLVRETFKISRVGTIAGCYVQEGKIHRNNRIRLIRDGMVVFTGGISSLKRFKDDTREVDAGFECGISLDGFNDLKIGDIIEAFERVETKRTLDKVAS